MTITITPIGADSASGKWSPTVGARTAEFVRKKTSGKNALSEPSMSVVLDEATEIMAHCVDPTLQSGSTAVLAVGYVQSGKTLSFTTVTSLARDNGFGMVIVLAGTTNSLKDQSEGRLAKDLGLEDLQRDWRHFNNPDNTGTYLNDIRQTLASWDRHRQGKTKEEKPAVLVTVLKHALRMSNAASVFSKLALNGVPVLVIDDESDQAGLNTRARQNLLTGTTDESGTYEAIVELKKSLPHHSYLQYTATPQANLLLAAADDLDPAFAKVISAGEGYTGGKTFFQNRQSDLVVRVPDAEIFDTKNPFAEPPKMLQESLAVFLLGIGDEASSDGKSNRSMMVQAHSNTAPHSLYQKWVTSLLKSWSDGLMADDENLKSEVADDFANAYEQLLRTVPELPKLSELLDSIADKIADVRVVIVNSTKDAEKDLKWKSWPYWILIGGQKLDRGFTVEGLTVTYMPRPVSDNADVLQQRARFFGYRSSYIDYCRVYLIKEAIEAFAGYVDDEEFLRLSLKEHEGKPLMAWKRDFVLHRQLVRPTRANVVGRSMKKLPLARGWIWPKYMHIDPIAVAQNRAAFLGLLDEGRSVIEDSTVLDGVVDQRAGAFRNMVWRDVSLSRVENFLFDLRFPVREDSLLTSTIEMSIGRLLKKSPGTVADVVFMSELKIPTGQGRDLSVLRDNIFVGMSPNGASGDQVVYSGDRTVVSSSQLTLQLRLVTLSSPTAPSGESYVGLPWLAMHLPQAVEQNAWLSDD